MTWHPISFSDLVSRISRELLDCSAERREHFSRTRITPAKWHLPPWGDEGGGFWAVAIERNRVLWYNDIEEGFNVSTFEVPGQIPKDEYGCNQDPLRRALPRLQGREGAHVGPPAVAGNGQGVSQQAAAADERRRGAPDRRGRQA